MRMVEEQIVGRGIRDQAILRAMRRIPRESFLPSAQRGNAYRDRPLPLGYGQTISQPYVVALMLSKLQLQGAERVLEIGTGSGYQTALLSELAGEVYSIEVVPELAATARDTLLALGCERVRTRVGDGRHGWPQAAPFATIIVSAAPPTIPEALVEQLADGGRMVIPVGGAGTQDLYLLTRHGPRVERKKLLPVRFVPLLATEQ
jgi:protein-L-isoaspartate(D-aspartate) O-methyltransferase